MHVYYTIVLFTIAPLYMVHYVQNQTTRKV